MASDYFDFKQFRVYHNCCAMKVGTDGVLLGALVPQKEVVSTILDIGTGSGILALMLAQRFSLAKIDANKIDPAAAQQALENFSRSKWHGRLKVFNDALQNFSNAKKYQIIISNPPYFVLEDAYQMPDSARKHARYTNTLTHQELLEKCVRLIEENGVIYVILPATISGSFIQLAQGLGLNQTFEVAIRMKPNAYFSRYILGFSLMQKSLERSEFTVYDESGTRSEAYAIATSDFYL